MREQVVIQIGWNFTIKCDGRFHWRYARGNDAFATLICPCPGPVDREPGECRERMSNQPSSQKEESMDLKIRFSTEDDPWLCFRHAAQDAQEGKDVAVDIGDYDSDYYMGRTYCMQCSEGEVGKVDLPGRGVVR